MLILNSSGLEYQARMAALQAAVEFDAERHKQTMEMLHTIATKPL